MSCLEATLPHSHRWLPKRMTVNYRAKAETSLRAVAELPAIPEFGDEGFELPAPFIVRDTAGKAVVNGEITIWVTPRK